MKKHLFYSIFFLLGIINSHGFAQQISDINAIKTKYFNFLTGNAVTSYSKNQISNHYNRLITSATTVQANLVTAYNLDNPGAVWNLVNSADDVAFYQLANNYLYPLVLAYQLKGSIVNGLPSNSKYHDEDLKALILKIFNYIKAKGVSGTSDFEFWIDNNKQILNTNRSEFGVRTVQFSRCIFLMKEELKAIGEFDYHMATLAGYTKFLGPQSPFPPPFLHAGYNADVVRVLIESRLCYVLGQDDAAADKLANMDYFIQFTNNAYRVSAGWSDFIKPDFMTFHHERSYPYAYVAMQ
jgi:chondroitin-sulfate-ABC endolyase/exolyase